MHDETKTAAPLTEAEEGLQLELAATRDELEKARRERDAARARVELLRQRLLSLDHPLVGRIAMLAALGGDQ